MVTVNSDTPYLGISFAEVLDIDTIQNLKEGFGMMGMRFTGKPNKAGIVKAYDEYVKGNPADVLRCLRPEDLQLMSNILKQGRGGYFSVKGTQIYNQLQKMNLVVSREDKQKDTTDFYLIDELHDLFAPHIDEVKTHPVDYSIDKTLKTPLDAFDGSEAIDGKGDDDKDDISPEERAELEQVLQSKQFQDVIEKIKKDRMDAMEEAERAEREDGPVKFLPAFTKHPAKYPPMKESYCATRLVRPRVFEVTIPLDDCLYFIVYFNFLEQNGYTQATCYWGNIFDFAQKAAAEHYPGAGYVMLSKPFRKKYPHVAAVYGMHDDNQDCRKPYLTTIGWEHQPKEWFLSVRLYNFDYPKLVTFSPLDCPEVIEAIDDLKKASLAMMRDIQHSDAKQPKLQMTSLFGLP